MQEEPAAIVEDLTVIPEEPPVKLEKPPEEPQQYKKKLQQ